MRIPVIAATSVLLIAAIPFLSFAPSVGRGDGLITAKSHHSVKQTADRLESLIKEKGLTLFVRINHAENAKKVGKDLRATELLVFGNPNIGTPLMNCKQSVAIDLPQKALIWEDETGQVLISYNDPQYLVDRHSITGCDDVIKKIEQALSKLTEAAAGPEQ
jgi:uncharacterized protein (DUF302 family)